MNIELKKALIERRVPIYKTAIEVKINPNKLSKFICGLAVPTEDEKEALAEILNKSVGEIFPEGVPA